MCIALHSTAHPDYPFILLSNRDEFLNRPTLPADWWDPPNQHVLGGRDTQRQERGTWLGITEQGRIAVLTNFRDEGVEVKKEKSRGAIPSAWLTASPEKHESPKDFAARLIANVGINDVGGFSLLFGELKAPKKDGTMLGLSILSNRSASAEDLISIASTAGETHGLSNSHFGDTTWPKVVHGEQLLKQAVKAHVSRKDASQNDLIASLFDILSVDMLPHRKPGEEWEVYAQQLRKSILISPSKGQEAEAAQHAKAGVNGTTTPDHGNVPVSGAGYGTQKQTVVLVDQRGHVVFVEKTLFDESGTAVAEGQGERRFEFDIQGWER